MSESQNPNIELDDVIPIKKDILDRFTIFSKFLRTRRQVLTGCRIWDLSKEQLKVRNLMNPWPFKLYQTVISAAPTIILGGIFAFLFQIKQPEMFSVPELDDFHQQVHNFFQKTMNFINPFLLPISLAFSCYAAARGSLLKKDLSKHNLKKAQRAYLYFDGAFGFWIQMIISSFGAILPWLFHIDEVVDEDLFRAIMAWLLLLYIGCGFQSLVSLRIIPQKLFGLNDNTQTQTLRANLHKTHTWLWVKYTIITSLFVPLFWVCACTALALLVYGMALVILYDQEWIKNLLSVQ